MWLSQNSTQTRPFIESLDGIQHRNLIENYKTMPENRNRGILTVTQIVRWKAYVVGTWALIQKKITWGLRNTITYAIDWGMVPAVLNIPI